eukprot:TRINITY_DN14861_c0_g1_i2.p2 TRINITY_DN14861_c0_g1~~TRINITY_DN14861_c0_g1_i2.p2  ORF type:complete len:430 (-),score=91.44 TRINITY_DN14861_c0_g1_i2:392-1681(-)
MADGEKCFPPPPGSGESISGGTFYQILGVPPTAELDEIKLSYKKLALKLHPDKNRDDPNATERFQELQEAYDVLQDPERRKAYDQNSDFILRAFSESDSDDSSVNFLSVPSSRTFWCLIVEAVLNDDGKSITAYAQQLEDEVFDEISKGGVCGFTWLHFAGYAGKPRAAKALIDLGVDVNAKTQPLCVTASQQFCRPTPLDLTYFIANKKVRENTLKVLQQADAAFGGVDMAKLESVWQGLIKNQLTLLKEEVLKFTEKIPVGVRRVLLKEARWRDIITFPGEDAKTMESKRTRRAMKAMANKVVWVLIGDKSMTAKARLGAILGNVFVFLLVWWLFNFDKFQLVQTVLIAVLFMCTRCCRQGKKSKLGPCEGGDIVAPSPTRSSSWFSSCEKRLARRTTWVSPSTSKMPVSARVSSMTAGYRLQRPRI